MTYPGDLPCKDVAHVGLDQYAASYLYLARFRYINNVYPGNVVERSGYSYFGVLNNTNMYSSNVEVGSNIVLVVLFVKDN